MNPSLEQEGLRADQALLRALLSARWLDNLPDAFMLRHNERDTGLSVVYNCSVAECRARFRISYGVAELILARVLELGLQVVPDEPKHANIKGVPYKEDDPEGAEWCASRLAALATIVDRGKQAHTPLNPAAPA